MTSPLFPALAAALACRTVEQKLALTAALNADWLAGKLDHLDDTSIALTVGIPAQPELVPHTQLRQRSPQTIGGRASLLHAIIHIEFTAINLALDHAARFRGMPAQYYADWIGVAAEEADHFTILRERLRALGHDYGDFPAHGGLSAMAERTRHDVLIRMALVPRLLEARGLDATPPIQKKLEACGDTASARVLDIILHDEIGHVGLGDSWFRHLCGERGLEPESTYRQLIVEYQAPWPQAPLNRQARLASGFTTDELSALLARRQPGEQRGI
jgi:uncharacterized ferritin-like protein (DUF455 family)